MESEKHKILKKAIANVIGGDIECKIEHGRADACNALRNFEVKCSGTKEKRKCYIQAYEKYCKKEKGKYNCDPLYQFNISKIINKCKNDSKSKDERYSCIKNEIGKKIEENELKIKTQNNKKEEK